ncbi:MAG: BTAD domain-containing putative transcriptional regulator [Acidimicrobiales bacterium]
MRLSVLGPIEVVIGGSPVPLGGPKERTLLAVLVVNAGSVVSDARLIDALWGDDPPRTAVQTLQNYVLRLRKTLRRADDHGDGTLAIETRPPGYRLVASPGAVDADRVVRLGEAAAAAFGRGDHEEADALLAEALAAWRGPSLPEFADQPFAVAEAARLDGLRQAMVEDQAEVWLALGRHRECVAHLEALAADQPLRERRWAQLMVALYRSGRQADALRAYQRARATLVDQLGIEPGPALRGVERAVIHQDPSLDLAPTPAPAADARSAGPPPVPAAVDLPPELRPAPHGVFVGRREETERLRAAWRDAAGGRGRATLLGGEPGIGKTTVAAELATWVAAAGGTVLYGRNDEDLGVPYQPFAEAARFYLAGRPPGDVLARARPLVAGLHRLLPELAGEVAVPDAAAGDPELDRWRLFDAVAALLATATAEAPTLLVLDDLHWATTPTLLLLRHLVRTAVDSRLLVVGTYRDTELGRDHPLAGALAELNRVPGVERMALPGLTEEEAVELVARRAGQDLDERGVAFARALHAETDGNPFFLAEILLHLVETSAVFRRDGRWVAASPLADVDLPTSVRELIGKRLARLGPPAARAVAVGAIVGSTFDLDLLERIPEAADDPDSLLDALDLAVGAVLVVEVAERPGTYAFAHNTVRQVVLSTLTAARRARLHRRVGETLESLPDADAHLGALARHFAGAGDVARATEYALRAGRQALDQLAFEAAVDHFQAGLAALAGTAAPDVGRRAELSLAVADARALAGDRAGGVAAATTAAADARSLASADLLARAAMVRASLGVAGRPDADVGPLCEEALAALGDEPTVLRARLLARLAIHRALWEGRRVAAEELAEEALGLARGIGDPGALHLAVSVRAVTLVGSPQVDLRLDLAEELVAAAEAAGDRVMRAGGFRLRALARLERGDVAGFGDDLGRVEALAATLRRRQYLSEAARWRAMLALFEGRWADAEVHGAEMLAQAGDDVNARSARVCQAFVAGRDRGRLDEARQAAAAGCQDVPGLVALRAVVALADAESGRVGQARAELDRLSADRFAAIPRDFTWTASLSTLAELCHALDDGERAGRLFDLLLPHRGHLVVMGWGDACAGAVDRYLGTLAATAGRDGEAEPFFDAALALETATGSAPAGARTRLAWGRVLARRRGRGDADRARALLHAARDTAATAGMPSVAAEAAATAGVLAAR